MVDYLDVGTNPRGITILAVLWSLVALSGLFVGLRIYSKLSRSRRLWCDDSTVIFAWALLLLSLSSTTTNIRLVFGRRAREIPLDNQLLIGALSNVAGFASVLALLPWRLLLRFDMYNKEKVGVAIAMSMGIFAGISCIFKMTKIPLLYRNRDFSYNALPLVIWGFLEPAVTIMAASIPVMRQLFLSRRGARGRPTAATITSTSTTTRHSAASSSRRSSDTLRNPGRDSIGGSRESRLAAIRANRDNNNNDNNASNSDIDINIDLVRHDDLHIDDRATVPSRKGRI
ncbi:hypothetical protein VTG60DRAFT_6037 [Thermothelomyces hinnuleus]